MGGVFETVGLLGGVFKMAAFWADFFRGGALGRRIKTRWSSGVQFYPKTSYKENSLKTLSIVDVLIRIDAFILLMYLLH